VKILVAGIRGIPNVQGGVETHAEQLYPRLARLGCDVEVLVRAPFVPPQVRSFGQVRIRRLWSPVQPGYEALLHSLLAVCYAAVARPDVLHIHAVGPAIVTPLARLLGIRVVVTHHGPDYEREKWGPAARTILRLGERLGMRWASARIAISRTIADLVQSRFGVTPHVIPNGVVIHDRPRDSDVVTGLGLEPGRYFVHVARMVPEKRQLDLIAAFARRPRDWRLVLVGATDSGEYARQVRDAARAHGVLLPGFLGGDALRQIYGHAGAFLLPSSHEGLPIALLEALSYGLPVAASDIPANLEIGLPGECYFPLGDLSALSAQMDRLEQLPADEAARAARIRWTAERYDWDKIALQTLQVYRSVTRAAEWHGPLS
jgi:glycosyltransferase involved in cell wall biosynthesis